MKKHFYRIYKFGMINFIKYLLSLLIFLSIIALSMGILVTFGIAKQDGLTNEGITQAKLFTTFLYFAFYLLINTSFIIFIEKINGKNKSGELVVKYYLFEKNFIMIILTALISYTVSSIIIVFNEFPSDVIFHKFSIYVFVVHLLVCFIGVLSMFVYLHIVNLYFVQPLDIKDMNRFTRLFEEIRSFFYFIFSHTRFYLRYFFTIMFCLIIPITLWFEVHSADIEKFDLVKNSLLIFYIILLIFISAHLIGHIAQPPKKERLQRFNINGTNIEFTSIIESPIYIIKDKKIKKNYHLFKLNINEIFDENMIDKRLYIEEAYEPIYLDSKQFVNLDNIDEILILYNISNLKANNVLRLRLNLSSIDKSKRENKKYEYRYYDILINLSEYSNIIVPKEKYEIGYSKRTFNTKDIQKTMKNFSCGEYKNKEILKGIIIYAVSNVYTFNDINEDVNLNKAVSDNRKVLLHDNIYGAGKTTYDIVSIVSQGKIPIIVSPWEANYDHDILYLIFDSIRVATSTKRFNLFQGSIFYLYSIVIVISTYFLEDFIDMINPLIPNVNWQIIRDLINSLTPNIDYKIILYVIFYILVWIISREILKRLLPNLIIYKKNHTQIYKNFYINSIVEMISKKSNYILLVEDIDRLSKDTQDETFRILSSINSNLKKNMKAFAIISYDKSKKIEGIDYDAINNKIIYHSWGENFDKRESMKQYVELNLKVLSLFFHFNCSKVENSVLKLIENYDVNFRHIYSIFSNVKQEMINDDGNIYCLSDEQIFEIFDRQVKKIKYDINGII